MTKKWIDTKQAVNASDLVQLDWQLFSGKENSNNYCTII